MDPPFGMGKVHDKWIRASIGPPGRLRSPSPHVRILGLRGHLVELDVILMVHVELKPSRIGPGRLLLYDLPCHGSGGSIIFVVTVLGRSPELCIAVSYKFLMPLLANPFGFQIVPLYRLLIAVQLAVLYILIVDGVKVYGSLDLPCSIPVIEGDALDPPCPRPLLDRLAQPCLDLPVGLSLEHRLHPLAIEGEEGVDGRLPDIPPLVIGGCRKDIVTGLHGGGHPDICPDEQFDLRQVVLSPRLLAGLVSIVVTGVPEAYPWRLHAGEILLLNGILQKRLHIIRIKPDLLLERGVGKVFLRPLQAIAIDNLIRDAHTVGLLAALDRLVYSQFGPGRLVREMEAGRL